MTTAKADRSDYTRSKIDASTTNVNRPSSETLPSYAFENRQRFYRMAFTARNENIYKQVASLTNSPFVVPAYQYPSSAATQDSLRRNHTDARRQVGHRIVAEEDSRIVPRWTDCFGLLKRTTLPWDERTSISAMRVVLPPEVELDVDNKDLVFVESATGVLRELRSAVDKNPSAIVLRGNSKVLVKAADEIVTAYPEAKVYELGELLSSDYTTKPLWPAIGEALHGGTMLPDEKAENIWLHKEYKPSFRTEPYEQLPKPTKWTQDNLHSYIATLVYSRVPAHLAIPFYGRQGEHAGRMVDTEAIRVQLILEALEDPSARPYVTASVLNMALSLLASKGGHRSSADYLMKLAEEWGVPMDTETFNIMLEACCHNSDVPYFYKSLRDIAIRKFQPNIRTWLLFLRLLKTEDERRQVILAMYNFGMLFHSATRRAIAEIMAQQDAYSACKAGKSLDTFLKEQRMRYGPEWRSNSALNSIIAELLRFHRREDPRIQDAMTLVGQMEKVTNETVNLFLQSAASDRSWDTAFWALELCESSPSCKLDQLSYQWLVALAVRTCYPHSLGVLFFYGVLDRKHWTATRDILRNVILGRHYKQQWRDYPPLICPQHLISRLRENPIRSSKVVMSKLEHLILSKWAGWLPAQSLRETLALAVDTLDVPLLSKRHNYNTRGKSSGPEKPEGSSIQFKLVKQDGTNESETIRLNGVFVPQEMINDWRDRHGTDELSRREDKDNVQWGVSAQRDEDIDAEQQLPSGSGGP